MRHEEAGPRRTTPPAPLPPVQRPTGVLVVDDDDVLRAVLERELRRRGFAVWTAASGAGAVSLYRILFDHIAVVLTDVRMPGMGGAETAAALRRIDPAVRICFMTGEPADVPAVRVEQVFTKPFPSVTALADGLRRVAAGSPARPEGLDCSSRLI